jgi:hypothetical protein
MKTRPAHRIHASLLPVVLMAPALSAQFVVAPSAYQFVQASGTASSMLLQGQRWQQLHADLKGPARTFKALSLRRGHAADDASYAARTIEIEVKMADGKPAMSTTFASNYDGPAVTVFTKKLLNTPDWSKAPVQKPAPFLLVMSFDAPFAYAGTKELLWDLVTGMHNAQAQNLPVEVASTSTAITYGSTLGYGIGCLTANGTTVLSGDAATVKSTNAFSLSLVLTGAPGSAATGLMLGTQQMNAAFAGLCTNLYVNPQVVLNGTTDAGGTYQSPYFGTPYSPALVGGQIYAQAASVDMSKAGLPVAPSNGLQMTFAPMPPALSIAVCHGAASATTGTGIGGYGVVTRLGY